jgi:alpha-L-rhamnosidase
MHEQAEFARKEAENYKEAIRTNLIEFNTMCALGDCQSSQAMCLYYNIFRASEQTVAFDKLLEMIHAMDDHIDVGVLGGKVIFHVLSQFGYSDLAFKMITRDDYPSYGNWLKRGATTLWENFHPDNVSSMNHHFWGDISAFFYRNLAGIKINAPFTVDFKPDFAKTVGYVRAYHKFSTGKFSVEYKHNEDKVLATVTVPNGVNAEFEYAGAKRTLNVGLNEFTV